MTLPPPSKQSSSAPSSKTVTGATGTKFDVLADIEVKWWIRARDLYLDQYKFDNIADMQDLDRLLQSELLSFRWGNWLAREADYDKNVIDEPVVQKSLMEKDREIRLLKKHMGMDRKGRVESESQSTADYLAELKRRAKEFGVHRNTQVAKAIDLFMDLKTLIGLNGRTDDQEQAELGVTEHDIIMWVRDTAIPEYEDIDNAFRKNQMLWIRNM